MAACHPCLSFLPCLRGVSTPRPAEPAAYSGPRRKRHAKHAEPTLDGRHGSWRQPEACRRRWQNDVSAAAVPSGAGCVHVCVVISCPKQGPVGQWRVTWVEIGAEKTAAACAQEERLRLENSRGRLPVAPPLAEEDCASADAADDKYVTVLASEVLDLKERLAGVSRSPLSPSPCLFCPVSLLSSIPLARTVTLSIQDSCLNRGSAKQEGMHLCLPMAP